MITGNWEEPATDETISGSQLEMVGWAIADSGIDTIEISVDGKRVGEVVAGIERGDVAEAYPDVPNAHLSGFWYELDLAEIPNGELRICLVVTARCGDTLCWERSFIRSATVEKETAPQVCRLCANPCIVPRPDFSRRDYALYHCLVCGTGFVHPVPTTEELGRFYSDDYWGHAVRVAKNAPIHHDTDHIHGIITRHGSHVETVIDVGCGVGTLLNGLRDKGYRVSGQDFSSTASAMARDLFGLDVKTGPMIEIELPNADCVVMRHVLEHSSTPLSDLVQVIGRLNPGGLLIVLVPNYESFACQLYRRFWEWFVPPVHLTYFSLQSFRYLAVHLGFRILHSETRSSDALPYAHVRQVYERCADAYPDFPPLPALDQLMHRLHAEDPAPLYQQGFGEELCVVIAK